VREKREPVSHTCVSAALPEPRKRKAKGAASEGDAYNGDASHQALPESSESSSGAMYAGEPRFAVYVTCGGWPYRGGHTDSGESSAVYVCRSVGLYVCRSVCL
jgi:hypothetical protein